MIVGDEPVPGLYAHSLVRGGPLVAVSISIDSDGNFFAIVDGERGTYTVEQVWPMCARRPISDGEYRFMLRRAEWARTNSPKHPAANPRRKVNLRHIAPVKP
jgi:hypothetical protein